MVPLVGADCALECLVENRVAVLHLGEMNPGPSHEPHLYGLKLEVPFQEIPLLDEREIKVPEEVWREIKLIFVSYHLF